METKFIIRSCLKVELAKMYSPHLSNKSAMNKLNSWIRKNPALHHALYKEGREGKNDTSFSERQVGLIVHYLGEP